MKLEGEITVTPSWWLRLGFHRSREETAGHTVVEETTDRTAPRAISEDLWVKVVPTVAVNSIFEGALSRAILSRVW